MTLNKTPSQKNRTAAAALGEGMNGGGYRKSGLMIAAALAASIGSAAAADNRDGSRFMRGIDNTADAARRVACEKALRVQPHLKWFGTAVQGWDRAAWEAARLLDRNVPRYPGACRDFARR